VPPVTLARAEPDALAGRWLIHPWAIRTPPSELRPVGVLWAPFHRRWPWSERRWRFVLGAMSEVCDEIVWCEDGVSAAPVGALAETVADPHLRDWLPGDTREQQQRLFVWPQRDCRSFSDFWRATRLVSDPG
jgi:deoxyribodipyrimidine photo-lyase